MKETVISTTDQSTKGGAPDHSDISILYVLIFCNLLCVCHLLFRKHDSTIPISKASSRYDSNTSYLLKVASFVLIPTLSAHLAFELLTSTTISTSISEWYIKMLDVYPAFTKSVTTGIIQFSGDYIAQYYEQQQHQSKQQQHPPTVPIATINSTSFGTPAFIIPSHYNIRRGMTLFADGLLLSGPLLHYAFEYMEQIQPTQNDDYQTHFATMSHVLINDYIIDTIYIGLSFIFTSILEGYSLIELIQILHNDFWITVKASWCTSLAFIPIEFYCFGYLPLCLRVLAMNCIDLIWGTIISFFSHRSRRHGNAENMETHETDL